MSKGVMGLLFIPLIKNGFVKTINRQLPMYFGRHGYHNITKSKNESLNTITCKNCARTYSVAKMMHTSMSLKSKKLQVPLIGKRPVKKKLPQVWQTENDILTMWAYSTAEEYDLERLEEIMTNEGVYTPCSLPKDADDAFCMKAKYEIENTPREMFFFRQGCVVFWNMHESEMNGVLEVVRSCSDGVYPQLLVCDEMERMEYKYTQNSTDLQGGTICINHVDNDSDTMLLAKYAFSNAFCTSVKLGIWEALLDEFVESIAPILEDLKEGKTLRLSKHKVLRKTGELYTLRHLINLSSDLLEPPDFYWDRDDLERLYLKSLAYLNTTKRTRVINEKIVHCCDLTALLNAHLNDKHHVRLEWMIIVLISIEVLFEISHLVVRYTGQTNGEPTDATEAIH